jgi:hypothetical protein
MLGRWLVVVMAVAFPIAVPSAAQVPEELVTFVLVGVADGASIDIGGTEAVWRRVSGSKATFLAEGTRDSLPVRLSLTTIRIDDCRYEVNGSADVGDVAQSDTLQIKADFARIDAADVVDGQIVVSGEGLCVLDKVSAECHRDVSGIATVVDQKRHMRAFQELRTGLCQR